ncbi:MAG: glycosyltransferase family 2 protein [Myxococcota bacterium]
MPSVSVIIPVYNSEQSLPPLVDRLAPVLAAVAPDGHELILVNDASVDGSWNVITELAARHGWIRGPCLMRNYGQHNALLCGIREARGEIIVTMDDDLQHPPEEIPKLLARLDADTDVVYGTAEHGTHGFMRNLGSRLTKHRRHPWAWRWRAVSRRPGVSGRRCGQRSRAMPVPMTAWGPRPAARRRPPNAFGTRGCCCDDVTNSG